MALSSGYSSCRRLTISRGDQRFRSFSMTYRRRRSSRVNRLLPCLREQARTFARFPAENARYPLFPLLCCTSRETVLAARPNRLAIAERPVPCARPRLTFSRSADESRRYGVVVCIRIHRTHIRCVRCLTPSWNTLRIFSGRERRRWSRIVRRSRTVNVGQAPNHHLSCSPEQLTEVDLILQNVEGTHPESIEPLISANRQLSHLATSPVGSKTPLER